MLVAAKLMEFALRVEQLHAQSKAPQDRPKEAGCQDGLSCPKLVGSLRNPSHIPRLTGARARKKCLKGETHHRVQGPREQDDQGLDDHDHFTADCGDDEF